MKDEMNFLNTYYFLIIKDKINFEYGNVHWEKFLFNNEQTRKF